MAAEELESEVSWTRGPGYANLDPALVAHRKLDDATNLHGDRDYEILKTWEEASAIMAVMDEKSSAQFDAMSTYGLLDLPVEYTEYQVDDVDQLTCSVSVYRPKNQSGPLPCVVEVHPGGMCVLSGREGLMRGMCYMLANNGYVVVQPHFTNGHVEPFPRGLNDCCNAIRWANANRNLLQIDDTPILMQGASGGANLSVASALSLKGEIDLLGIWVDCPYFWNYDSVDNIPEELTSYMDNRGCDGNPEHNEAFKLCYTFTPEDRTNPLAWPYYATTSDFEGLCPVYLNENELSQFRSSTVAVYRKLQKAGVQSWLKVDYGSFHGGDDKNPTGWTIKYASRMKYYEELIKAFKQNAATSAAETEA